MKQRTKRILAMMLAFVMAISFGMTVIAEEETSQEDEEEYERMAQMLVQYLSDFADDVEFRYKYDITKEEILLSACKALIGDDVERLKTAIAGVLNNLDDYSHFYTGAEYDAIKEVVTGDRGAIGLQMRIDDNGFVLVSGFVEGMPAASSGIQVGDILLTIDGQSVGGKSSSEISKMVAGSPGSQVVLVFRREGVEQPLSFTLTRAAQIVNPVTSKTIDDSIQYIKIEQMNANADQYFQDAMDVADAKKIDKIILDLRNNGGGTLSSAIGIISRFIPKDQPIVTLKFKDEKYDITYKSQGLSDKKYQVVLLVNEYSASASEVIAGALKDYGAAYLIGETTYGKGAVQQFSDLNGLNSGMNLTVAHYLTPNGTDVQNTGIQPDQTVVNEVKRYSAADFSTLDYLHKPKLGDQNDQVRGIKQRLIALGYELVDDDVFDEETEQAVKSFQQQAGLYPYGVADLTTQIHLNNRAITAKKIFDTQLEYAVGHLENSKES